MISPHRDLVCDYLLTRVFWLDQSDGKPLRSSHHLAWCLTLGTDVTVYPQHRLQANQMRWGKVHAVISLCHTNAGGGVGKCHTFVGKFRQRSRIREDHI